MNDSSYRILLVDDSPEDREFCRRLLTRTNEAAYEVVEKELGEEGLRYCQQERPDCVVLDYMLPDLDGLEFLAQLQNKSGELSLPVVMLTGHGSEVVAVQAIKCGVEDYLMKG